MAAGDVLTGLGNAELVGSALGLDGYYELLAVPIHADVNLVDLDLSHVFDERLQVVLQGVGGDTEKDVDQPVIANLREEGLLVR